MHKQIEPGILYFGTPVVLISTANADGTFNLAPMSSAFWLGWRGILGLDASSKSPENMLRTRECVLNLPSTELAPAVDRLAKTTGTEVVPLGKQKRGYRFEKSKFELAGLTPVKSEIVAAPRAEECPVQLEAKVEAVHGVGEDNENLSGRVLAFEVRIVRVHAHTSILSADDKDRIDPDKWRPLIMSFQQFYGLSERAHASALSEIPERMYRGPDIGRARREASSATQQSFER